MAEQANVPETLAAQHGAVKPRLPGAGVRWLDELREAGIERFRALGLPTPKVEAWKYTNLRPLERAGLVPAEDAGATVSLDRAPSFLGEAAGHRLVFVNGRVNPALSETGGLPDGVHLTSLAAALGEEADLLEAHLGRVADGAQQPLLALNTAFLADGAVLHVGRGVAVERPIELVFAGAGGERAPAYHPRLLIVLEAGAQATVVEHHAGLGADAYLANGAAEVVVGEGAALRHYRMQAESPKAFHVTTLHARLAAGALYDGFGLTTGGRLTRNELTLRLEGAGAEARLSGGYLQRGKQHVDNTTLIEHTVPDTTCREVFKGALDDKARAVFQGKLVVHRDAQRTDGHQLSQALLLSETAESDAKPELEIYADDVKCSHGSTSGSLDQEALFYLRTRGLPYRAAQRLLVESFVGEVVEEITAEGLGERFMAEIGRWLGAEPDRGSTA